MKISKLTHVTSVRPERYEDPLIVIDSKGFAKRQGPCHDPKRSIPTSWRTYWEVPSKLRMKCLLFWEWTNLSESIIHPLDFTFGSDGSRFSSSRKRWYVTHGRLGRDSFRDYSDYYHCDLIDLRVLRPIYVTDPCNYPFSLLFKDVSPPLWS